MGVIDNHGHELAGPMRELQLIEAELLSKREYQALGSKMPETALANLATLSDTDLEKPVKGDGGRFMPTLGDLFLGRIGELAGEQSSR